MINSSQASLAQDTHLNRYVLLKTALASNFKLAPSQTQTGRQIQFPANQGDPTLMLNLFYLERNKKGKDAHTLVWFPHS